MTQTREESRLCKTLSTCLLQLLIILSVIQPRTHGLGRYAFKNETEEARAESRLRRRRVQTEHDTGNGAGGSGSASIHRVPMVPKQLHNRVQEDRQLGSSKDHLGIFNAQNETLVVLGVLTAAFLVIVTIQVWRQIKSYRKKSVRRRRRKSGAEDECDCANIEQLIEKGGGEGDGQTFDSLMVRESYSRGGGVDYNASAAAAAESPPIFARADVVHLSMNIVQVVHHGGQDADTCPEKSCRSHHDGQKSSKKAGSGGGDGHRLAKILDSASAEPEVIRTATTTIITVDETAEDVIKRIVDTAGGAGTVSKKDAKKTGQQGKTTPQDPTAVNNFKYKALKEDASVVSQIE